MLARYNEEYTHLQIVDGSTQKKKVSGRKKQIMIQKMLGLAAVGISVLELLAGYMGMIDEGGAFIFMLPIGLYALFTKEKML